MPAFSGRERVVLGVLADTFVPGDGERRSRLAAEALEQVVDPSQLRQLQLVLQAMDSRAANLLLTGRPQAFTSVEGDAARKRERRRTFD